MEENKKTKVTLKAIGIIACITIIVAIGVCIIVIKSSKMGQTSNNDLKLEETSEEHIYNKEIQSIKLQYYEGYNIATGDVISDTIPLNTIDLQSDNLKAVSDLIKMLTKVEFSEEDEEMNNRIKYNYICDYYRLVINNNFIIYMGDKYGFTEKENTYFEVSKELYDKIFEIIQNNNQNNLYKTIDSKKITIICKQEKYEISDIEQLSKLSNFQYYVINASDRDFDNEEVAYTLDLNDGRKIDVYFASVLSCIYYKDGTHEYIYTGDLEDYIKKDILK